MFGLWSYNLKAITVLLTKNPIFDQKSKKVFSFFLVNAGVTVVLSMPQQEV